MSCLESCGHHTIGVKFLQLYLSFKVTFVVMDTVNGGSATPSVTADGKTSSPLMHIEGLLEALTVADKDGRIVVDRQGESLTLNVSCYCIVCLANILRPDNFLEYFNFLFLLPQIVEVTVNVVGLLT